MTIAPTAPSSRPAEARSGPGSSRPGAFAVATIVASLAAAAVLFLLVRPVKVGPVGFDSAASVIHFERIIHGQHLEAFVTTTPKPLLTVVFGAIHGLVPDWRAISLATIAASGLAILLMTLTVTRSVGPSRSTMWLAVLATPLVLVGSPLLVTDVGLAYAVPWALAGVAVAGVGSASQRPRAWLVGLGLLLATLARLEAVAITGIVALALAIHVARRQPWRSESGWDGRSLVVVIVIASSALPIMLVHDWLLTGDPLFWLRVSAAFSAATATLPTPVDVAESIARLVTVRPLPAALALVGAVVLWRQGSRPLLAGLIAMGPGLGALLLVLAARGTYVSGRYYAGIELSIAISAVVGAAAIGGALVHRLGGRGREFPGWNGHTAGTAAGWVAACILVAVIVLAGPFAPLDRSVRSALASQRTSARIADRSGAVVADLFAASGLAGGQPAPEGATTQLWVPVLLRPRMAVDLDLPLWAINGLGPQVIDPASGRLQPGVVIVHASALDRPLGSYGVLQTGGSVTIGDQTLETVAMPDADTWVLQVR